MLTSGFQNRRSDAPGLGGENLFAPAEADIMRLVAVLALCLMLLFSAEQHFADQPAPVEAPPMEELKASAVAETMVPETVVPETAVPETAVTAESPSKELVAPDEPVTASTPKPTRSEDLPVAAQLYFSSDVALLSLLVRQRIAVYAEHDGQWRAVNVDNVRSVTLPREPVYQLRADTVPQVLRDRAADSGVAETSRWAIWLEPSIDQSVMEQIGGGEGRSIVIETTGRVRALDIDKEPEVLDE